MATADLLSWKPISRAQKEEELAETSIFVNSIIKALPMSDQWLSEIKQHQELDPVCQKLVQYTQDRWPEKRCVPQEVLTFWSFRQALSTAEGLLYNTRLYIPPALCDKMLQKLHGGHIGIMKCCRLA